MIGDDDSWEEVRYLRRQAERFAARGDTLGAAYYDTRASQMVERMRAKEKTTDADR